MVTRGDGNCVDLEAEPHFEVLMRGQASIIFRLMEAHDRALANGIKPKRKKATSCVEDRLKRKLECLAWIKANPTVKAGDVERTFVYSRPTAYKLVASVRGGEPSPRDQYEALVAENPRISNADAAARIGCSLRSIQGYARLNGAK